MEGCGKGTVKAEGAPSRGRGRDVAGKLAGNVAGRENVGMSHILLLPRRQLLARDDARLERV